MNYNLMSIMVSFIFSSQTFANDFDQNPTALNGLYHVEVNIDGRDFDDLLAIMGAPEACLPQAEKITGSYTILGITSVNITGYISGNPWSGYCNLNFIFEVIEGQETLKVNLHTETNLNFNGSLNGTLTINDKGYLFHARKLKYFKK